jgi:hypothetical protein
MTGLGDFRDVGNQCHDNLKSRCCNEHHYRDLQVDAAGKPLPFHHCGILQFTVRDDNAPRLEPTRPANW